MAVSLHRSGFVVLGAWLRPRRSLRSAKGARRGAFAAAAMFSVLAAAVTATPAPAAPGTTVAGPTALSRAQQLLEAKQPKEARLILEPLVRRQRGNPEPLYWLGKANLEEGRIEQSVRLARLAVSLGDTVARYHTLLGQALWRWTSDPDPARVAESQAEFERAIALDSTSVAARLGLLELYLGRPGTRADSLRHAFLVPDSIPGRVLEVSSGPIRVSARAMALLQHLPILLIMVVLLATGLAVGLMRQGDPAAFRFALFCVACTMDVWVRLPLVGLWPLWLQTYVGVASYAAFPVLAVAGMQLFASFPHPSRWGRVVLRWQWIPIVFFAWVALGDLASFLGDMFESFGPFADAMRPFRVQYPWPALTALPLLLSLLIAQRWETRRQPRKRLRTLEWGLFIAFLSGGLLIGVDAWPYSWGSRALAVLAYRLGNVAGPLGMLLGFLLVSHAVVARRVFGLRLLVRRGLQHLLLSRGVLMVEGVAIFLVLALGLQDSLRPLAGSLPAVAGLSVAGTFLIAATLRRVNRPLMRVLDERFFTEAYDARRVLSGLAGRISRLADREAILEAVGPVVSSELHPARLAFLLRDPDGRFAPAWCGEVRGRRTPATRGTVTPEDMEELAVALRALSDGETWFSWPPSREQVDAGLDLTRPAPFEQLLALRTGDELVGALALATKLSEEPYTSEDRELLEAVAAQMALALRNAALVEVARREARQARDLEIARRVQRSLFPQVLPAIEGWDLAVLCRPAREVGGDYYDLFEVGPGRLAVALGDVTGKGLGASLLTAGLHAMVRSHLPQRSHDLGGLTREINDHLLASTPPEIFTTLFLGVLDTSSGTLRYVNAGHPPPLVLRPGAAAPLRLDTGGLLVGILPNLTFQAGEATLPPGSTMLVYSDGLSEAEAAGGAMFEEERIVAGLKAGEGAAGAAAGCSGAAPVLQTLLAAVDAFTAGAEQSDDITLIVVKRDFASGAPPARSAGVEAGHAG